MRRAAVIFAAMLALSGCYTTKMVVSDAAPARADIHMRWQHTFFWGALSPGNVDLTQFCGDRGVSRVRTQVGGIGLLAYVVTAGIWVPVQVRVTCAKAPNDND